VFNASHASTRLSPRLLNKSARVDVERQASAISSGPGVRHVDERKVVSLADTSGYGQVRQQRDADIFLHHRYQGLKAGCGDAFAALERSAGKAGERMLLQAVTALQQQKLAPAQIIGIGVLEIGKRVIAWRGQLVSIGAKRVDGDAGRQIMRQCDQKKVKPAVNQAGDKRVGQFFPQQQRQSWIGPPDDRQSLGQEIGTNSRNRAEPDRPDRAIAFARGRVLKIFHLSEDDAGLISKVAAQWLS
jgi:hypothetical protein